MNQANTFIVSAFKRFSKYAGAFTVLVGGVVLVGWAGNIGVFKAPVPGTVSMKVNTALAFVFAGIALWLLQTPTRQGHDAKRTITLVCASIVALIGLLTLAEWIMGVNLRIDELIFKDDASAVGTASPGRAAPNTALNFLILGCVLILLEMEQARQHQRLIQSLTILAAIISFLGLLGYLYGVTSLTGLLDYTKMAIHTAVVFIVLCIGILFLQSDLGLMAILTNDSLGGQTARRFTLAAITLPVIAGLVIVQGERAKLYDSAFALSALVVLIIVLFEFLSLVSAASLHKADMERQQSAWELKTLNAMLEQRITERKRAEEVIREMNANLEQRVRQRTVELEASNEELETFAYTISHDLRAPLRGIDGFSQALQRKYGDQLDERGLHYFTRILENTRLMGQMIEELLQLPRLFRRQLQRQPVDLSALIHAIATELRGGDPARPVEFVIAANLLAEGDDSLLKIVFHNLLENAWKFTRTREKARIEVGVVAESMERRAESVEQEALSPIPCAIYFVRDNGVGFDMAYADKLFGAFQRLHSPGEFPGTGIGLATVQRVIHRHGGRVWAEAALDQGATFYFTLGEQS